MCVLRAACSVVRKQFFVNKLAKNVSGQDMGFLNSRSLVAGDTNAVIHDIPQLPSGLPRKPDRKQFLLPRLTDGLKHVGGVSTRADGKSHVTSASAALTTARRYSEDVSRLCITDAQSPILAIARDCAVSAFIENLRPNVIRNSGSCFEK